MVPSSGTGMMMLVVLMKGACDVDASVTIITSALSCVGHHLLEVPGGGKALPILILCWSGGRLG